MAVQHRRKALSRARLAQAIEDLDSFANPTALALSTAMLLSWFDQKKRDQRCCDTAGLIERGIQAAMRAGTLTRDLGGRASRTDFTRAVINAIRDSPAPARERAGADRPDALHFAKSLFQRSIAMPARVKGLGHVGLYVRDLEVMKEFWGGFMGMTLTKCNENVAFYSADPEAVDHEIAVMRGSRPAGDPHLVQQISLRVDKLDDVRDFHRRAKARGYRIDRVVTHGSAIGCYFRDPEDNPVEVFWLTGRTSWAVIAVPMDIERSDDELMAESDRVWAVSGKVEMGVAPQGELKRALQDLNAKTATAPVN